VTSWAFWVGIVVVAALSAALGYQVAVVRASAVAQAQVRKQFRGVQALVVPHDEFERRTWYVMTLLPGVAAVLISAVVFGTAHLYLGWGLGVLRASVVGIVFGATYLLTGSLWVPIVLHAAVDVTSGLTGSVALGQGTSVTSEGSALGGQEPDVKRRWRTSG
jgi:hypothetical protein